MQVEGEFECTVFYFLRKGIVMNVSIAEVKSSEFQMCLDVIHQSFKTVADEFGLTQENCPKHTSFIPLCFLETQMNWGWHMYALYDGKKIIGYMSLSKESDDAFELHNLAVLPEYRHNGFGKLLLDFAKEKVISLGGTKDKDRHYRRKYRIEELVHCKWICSYRNEEVRPSSVYKRVS